VARRFSGIARVLHLRRRQGGGWTVPLQDRCLVCGLDLEGEEIYHQYRVCPACRFHYSLTARQRIALLVDPGSFKEHYRTVASLDPLSFRSKVPYRKRLFRDQRRTGLTEAAVVGSARIEGQPVVLLVLDFGFMGGSLGCVVGEKVALAFERAGKNGLPLVAVVSSGGARFQEGPLSAVQMAKVVLAVRRFQEKGLPYLCVMASPTTGQVYASFANLADILLAEPGALLGVRPQPPGNASPPEEHLTAEAHLARGLLDGVCDRVDLRPTLARLLRLLTREAPTLKRPRLTEGEGPESAWEALQRVRHPTRPGSLTLLRLALDAYLELRGDRQGHEDLHTAIGLGELEGRTVVFIAQERDRRAEAFLGPAWTSPASLYKARRAMDLAERFRLPLITLVDTPGPDPTPSAQVQGLGPAIASTLARMASLPVPTVAVVVGEGGSEPAMALTVADRVLMLANAIFTPTPPEEAARLMYRDSSRVQEAVSALHITARHLREMGIVDWVVAEPGEGAHTDPQGTAQELRRALVRALAETDKVALEKRLKKRYKKYRRMGEYTSYFRLYLARELDALRARRAEPSTPSQKEPPAEPVPLTIPTSEEAPPGPDLAGQE